MATITKIRGHIENYHWGKKGSLSFISKLIKNHDSNLPYAELWFGAHQRGPSPFTDSQGDLRDFINRNPQATLGSEVSEKFKGELPFLLKILSVEKALSLQLHPDKVNAEALHENDKVNYPDNNHKPEIAVALSEVHLLYGFRPVSEIKKVLRKTPEFSVFINDAQFNQINSAREKNMIQDFMRLLYEAVLHAPKAAYKTAGEALIKRITGYSKLNRHEKLIIECAKEYGPEDLGIFSILLMNYLVLHPGQAIFTIPNTIHAFLRGDLIECMANSDNVVRAGMTPKYKDIKTLERIIDYKMSAPKVINGTKITGGLETIIYQTACREFELSTISGNGKQKLSNKKNNPGILLCIDGAAEIIAENDKIELIPGEACFIPAVFKEITINSRAGRIARVSLP